MIWSLKPLLKTSATWQILELDIVQDKKNCFPYQRSANCSDCLGCKCFWDLDFKFNFQAEGLVMLRGKPLCPSGTEFPQGVYVKTVWYFCSFDHDCLYCTCYDKQYEGKEV